jgi:hypothetical protein
MCRCRGRYQSPFAYSAEQAVGPYRRTAAPALFDALFDGQWRMAVILGHCEWEFYYMFFNSPVSSSSLSKRARAVIGVQVDTALVMSEQTGDVPLSPRARWQRLEIRRP